MEGTKQMESNAQTCCAPAIKSRWLNSRNVLIGAAVVAGGAGLFLSWGWLVAAGVASVIVGVLPCLAMCAAGLCMGRMGRKEPAPAPLPPKAADAELAITPVNEPGSKPAKPTA